MRTGAGKEHSIVGGQLGVMRGLEQSRLEDWSQAKSRAQRRAEQSGLFASSRQTACLGTSGRAGRGSD